MLEIKKVSKSFGKSRVLDDVSITVGEGEFLTILGPSGCGKTTLLRVIAGLEKEDAGDLMLDGALLGGVPPNIRPFNTVFQSYALFPHMSVRDNVAFGLKMNKMPTDKLSTAVDEALSVVRLNDLENRKPSSLSGGQQQRVAIARAIANKPKILLLDEPLSALDAKLRQDMQVELKKLQRQLNITFVLVTHDQDEALSISDRIVIMNDGRIQQIGTPRDVYETPQNMFVAQFIGDINILEASVISHKGGDVYLVKTEGIVTDIESSKKLETGSSIRILLRPEDMRVESLEDLAEPAKHMHGNILSKHYKGATLDSTIALKSNTMLKASEFFDETDEDFDYTLGEEVGVSWVKGWEVIFNGEDEAQG